MNQKVYHTLEYYKILERLADYASCEEQKTAVTNWFPDRSCGNCTPAGNYGRRTQPPVPRKWHQFFRRSQCQRFLKRLDIGGTLNTTELLMICSLLEVAKRVKAYDRSDRNDEKTDSLSPLFHRSSRFLPFWMKSAAVLSGKTKLQTTPLRHFLKSVNPSGDERPHSRTADWSYEQHNHPQLSAGCCDYHA